MPCTMTGSFEGDRAMERDEAIYRATRATHAACSAFKLLESMGIPLTSLRAADQKWWRLHKLADSLDPAQDFINIARLRAGIED